MTLKTWIKRTILRNEDGSYKAAEGADINHVVHDAVSLAADQRGPVTLEYAGQEVQAAPDSDPLLLRYGWEKAAKSQAVEPLPTPAPKAKEEKVEKVARAPKAKPAPKAQKAVPKAKPTAPKAPKPAAKAKKARPPKHKK